MISFIQMHKMPSLPLREPVTSLISTSTMQTNFTTLDVHHAFANFARVRVTSLSLRMYDSEDKLIPSPGTGVGETFLFTVTYPLVFNDKTTDKDVVTFLGQKVVCTTGYYTKEGRWFMRYMYMYICMYISLFFAL